MISVKVTRNHAIFAALSIMLLGTAIASSHMVSAKNTSASTLTSTQRPSLGVSSTTNQINCCNYTDR